MTLSEKETAYLQMYNGLQQYYYYQIKNELDKLTFDFVSNPTPEIKAIAADGVTNVLRNLYEDVAVRFYYSRFENINSLESRQSITDGIRSFFNNEIQSRATGIVDNTKGFLQSIYRRVVGDRTVDQELRKIMQQEVNTLNVNRSTVISGTETHTASNYGMYAYMNDIEGQGIAFTRFWGSVLGPTTRKTHAAAHKQKANKDGLFLIGRELLRFPGDPRGSVANTVNCLCFTYIGEIE